MAVRRPSNFKGCYSNTGSSVNQIFIISVFRSTRRKAREKGIHRVKWTVSPSARPCALEQYFVRHLNCHSIQRCADLPTRVDLSRLVFHKKHQREPSSIIPTVRVKPNRSNLWRMRLTQLLACCSVLVLCLHEGTALKCRTDDLRTSDRFQRVIERCRDRVLRDSKRMTDENSASDDDSDDDDSYDDDGSSDSEEKDSDKKGRTGRTNTSLERTSRPNNKSAGDETRGSRRYEQSSGSRPYPYDYKITNNASSVRSDAGDDRFSQNITAQNGPGSDSNFGHNDMRSNQRDQACVVHCFFDELNLIDRNGFPEKSAVARIMTQDIRDRELQNFIEEAVTGCFYMIDAVANKEQCKFSRNLLNCLASRGREKCEDWEYE